MSQAEAAASAISTATHILVHAGAGMSADSGLPVFAAVTDALQNEGKHMGGYSYDTVAALDSFCSTDPTRRALFYGFWWNCVRVYGNAEPHEGYRILRRWCDGKSSAVCTSNVDGFFRRAGFPLVSEIHGSMRYWQCGGTLSGKKFPAFAKERCGDDLTCTTSLEAPPVQEGLRVPDSYVTGNALRCPRCGTGRMRPNVYLFGDGKNFVDCNDVTGQEEYKCFTKRCIEELKHSEDNRLCVIEIGCGLRVPSLRTRSERMLLAAPKRQATLIRINPEYPHNYLEDGVDERHIIGLSAGALDALMQLDAVVTSI